MRAIDPQVPRTVAALTLVALFFAVPATGEAVGAATSEETPLAAATRFARAFERQDFVTVRALFTPDATVSRVELPRSGEPRFYRFSAAAWADSAERNHAHLQDLRLELLDSTTATLEQGAVVNLRYRFTGRAGQRSFVSEGIDTYSLIRMAGSWRVLQYGYLERIELF